MSTHHDSPASKERQDLRQHPRFPIDEMGIKVLKPGLLSSLGLGNKAQTAVNLSEGGILILTQDKLEEGAKVKVKLDYDALDEHIASEGEVRWCTQSARGAKDYYVGIRFKGLRPADQKKINRMRSWFLSPEFKIRATTRRKQSQPE